MTLPNTQGMARYGMTPRQHDLMDFIDRYVAENGASPSFQEMQEALGLGSKSGVHRILERLTERNLINRLPGKSRSIVINRETARFVGFGS